MSENYSLFEVYKKGTDEIHHVFGVTHTPGWEPLFLMYEKGEWKWEFAGGYEPK